LKGSPRSKDWLKDASAGKKIDDQWSYFETQGKPKKWDSPFRVVFIRRKNKKQRKGPLQLKLFEPIDFQYDSKVISTNKTEFAKAVVLFHSGRGSQKGVFGDAKNHSALGVIPCRKLAANQIFTLSSMMDHNLTREMQMLAHPAAARSQPKRPAAWKFQKLNTIRRRIIQEQVASFDPRES